MAYSCRMPDLHRTVEEFVEQAGIDTSGDITDRTLWTPRLAVQGGGDATTMLIVDEGGTDYFFTQLDYVLDDEVMANRMVAEIPAGGRTDLAYWAEAAGPKLLTTHRGLDTLVLCRVSSSIVEEVPTDCEILREVTLPPGHFYTIQAHPKTPLVISGYYEPPVDWSAFEVDFQPSETSVTIAAEGTLPTPASFRNRFLSLK